MVVGNADRRGMRVSAAQGSPFARRLRGAGGASLILGAFALGAPCAAAQEGAASTPVDAARGAPESPGANTPATVYEPAYFARFAPKSAADMVFNIPGFDVTGGGDDRGFGQARQNILINGRRVSGKSNDAGSALGRIAADAVVRIEIVDGAALNIPGLSGQVANVIARLDTFGGSWNWNPEFRKDRTAMPFRGSVSANGSTDGGWSWSAELNTFAWNGASDGPGIITTGAGQITEIREEAFNGRGQTPSLAATLSYETADGGLANLNLNLNSFNFVGREDSLRTPAANPPVFRFSSIGEDERSGEIGGDYEFDLGPGRLKLIALQSYEEERGQVIVESFALSGAALRGEKVDTTSEEGESIVRAEYGLPAFAGEVQWAAESAFNYLDVVTDLGVRQPDGSYPMTSLPEGSARVEESRAETNLSYSRELFQGVNLQSSLGVEYSELVQSGAGGQTREFVRPKGFVAVAWKPAADMDINIKGERRVGQLDFGDFLSSIDIQNDNASAGNAELVPEQAWVASAEINRQLGAWGAVKLTMDYSQIEDAVDQVPIGASGSGVGNVAEATAWSAAVSGTLNLDPIGAKGVQLNFNWRYADSEIADPLTGQLREISYSDKQGGEISVRWDVPDTPWTLSGGIEEEQRQPGYRLDQISRERSDPVNSFISIENKDVFGLKVWLQADNLGDSSRDSRRDVYQNGRRTNPLSFTEERFRRSGQVIRLNVSGRF